MKELPRHEHAGDKFEIRNLNIRTGGSKLLSQVTGHGKPYTCNDILQYLSIKWSRNYHLHQILLYSHQHLLPTKSVLHHDNPSHLQHTVELHYMYTGKE